MLHPLGQAPVPGPVDQLAGARCTRGGLVVNAASRIQGHMLALFLIEGEASILPSSWTKWRSLVSWSAEFDKRTVSTAYSKSHTGFGV